MEQNAKKKGVNQLNSLINPLNLLVHPEGFGPPTPGFEVRCSIQLSYGCVFAEPMDTMFMDQGQWLSDEDDRRAVAGLGIVIGSCSFTGIRQPIFSACLRK